MLDISKSLSAEGDYNTATTAPKGEWLPTLCHDGSFRKTYETLVAGPQCSFITSGIGFQQTMILKGNTPYLWNDHCRIISQCISNLNIPFGQLPETHELLHKIEVLANKNRYPANSYMRLSVWVDDDGNNPILTHDPEVHYLLTQQRIERSPFEKLKKRDPIFLKLYEEERLPLSPFTKLPIPTPIDVRANRFAIAEKMTAAVLLNHDGTIARSSFGNIFILINDTLITNRPSSGMILDAFSETIEIIARKKKLNVQYTDGISLELMRAAEECMTASTPHGLNLVIGFEEKRYFCKRLDMLIEDICKHLEPNIRF